MARIPVTNTLLARGLNVTNQMCPFCNNDLESVNHLFLHRGLDWEVEGAQVS